MRWTVSVLHASFWSVVSWLYMHWLTAVSLLLKIHGQFSIASCFLSAPSILNHEEQTGLVYDLRFTERSKLKIKSLKKRKKIGRAQRNSWFKNELIWHNWNKLLQLLWPSFLLISSTIMTKFSFLGVYRKVWKNSSISGKHMKQWKSIELSEAAWLWACWTFFSWVSSDFCVTGVNLLMPLQWRPCTTLQHGRGF